MNKIILILFFILTSLDLSAFQQESHFWQSVPREDQILSQQFNYIKADLLQKINSTNFQDQLALQKYFREKLKNYSVIFVGGLFANYYSKAKDIAKGLHLDQFNSLKNFQDSMQWMKSSAIHVLEAHTNTQKGIAQNAFVIANTIAQALHASPQKKIIVITHSKGGVDFLHTLIAYPEITSHVQAWIPLQAPFAGTPLTSIYKKIYWLSPFINSGLRLGGGDQNTLKELSLEERGAYLRRHSASIQDIIRRVSVLPIVASLQDGQHSFKLLDYGCKKINQFIYSHLELFPQGYLGNDGVVPAQSGRMAGLPQVIIRGLHNHGSLVMELRPLQGNELERKNERIGIILASLEMILRP